MATGELSSRKNDHLDIVLDPQRARASVDNGFQAYRFEHNALPHLHLDHDDI